MNKFKAHKSAFFLLIFFLIRTDMKLSIAYEAYIFPLNTTKNIDYYRFSVLKILCVIHFRIFTVEVSR